MRRGCAAASLNQLTKNLACEWAQDSIRVNAVAPWYIATPLTKPVLADEAYNSDVLARTPMGRVGEVQEVSGAHLCPPTRVRFDFAEMSARPLNADVSNPSRV